MLYANPTDSSKISQVLENVLKQANANRETFVLVNLRNFYRACHLSKLQRTKFQAELEDMLTCSDLVDNHGLWVIGEYGDGAHALVKVPHSSKITEFEFAGDQVVMKTHTDRSGVNDAHYETEDGVAIPADDGGPYGRLTKFVIRYDNVKYNLAFYACVLAAHEEQAVEMAKARMVKAVTEFLNNLRRGAKHLYIHDVPADFWQKEDFKVTVSHDDEVLKFDFDRIDNMKPIDL